jgi:hypothetical protein
MLRDGQVIEGIGILDEKGDKQLWQYVYWQRYIWWRSISLVSIIGISVYIKSNIYLDIAIYYLIKCIYWKYLN